jgi:hypothetical protein
MRFIGLVFLAMVLTLSGCASSVTSTPWHNASSSTLGKIVVVRFEPDNKHLNAIIAEELTRMGYPAEAVEEDEVPKDAHTVVTYRDNWQWDITMYMIKINIKFRNGETRHVFVSGESYRTSLIREAPRAMIKETLEQIFKKRS